MRHVERNTVDRITVERKSCVPQRNSVASRPRGRRCSPTGVAGVGHHWAACHDDAAPDLLGWGAGKIPSTLRLFKATRMARWLLKPPPKSDSGQSSRQNDPKLLCCLSGYP